MKDFRCKKCRQLQFKHKLEGDIIRVEIKCYACNTFNYFIVNLASLLNGNVQETILETGRELLDNSKTD